MPYVPVPQTCQYYLKWHKKRKKEKWRERERNKEKEEGMEEEREGGKET